MKKDVKAGNLTYYNEQMNTLKLKTVEFKTEGRSLFRKIHNYIHSHPSARDYFHINYVTMN